MKKITHINFGITTGLASALFLKIVSPVYMFLPFLAVLSDADHGKDGLSRKGLSLPGKHRGWSHSIFGTIILAFFVSLILYGITYISKFHGIEGIDKMLFLILKNFVYIGGVYIGLSIVSFVIFKILGKFSKLLVGLIMLFGFIISISLLYYNNLISVNIYLINLLIVSHLLGDYFTVSGIPLLYPLAKERFRFIFYVSTNTKGEEFIKFIITIINLIILFYLVFKSNYIDYLINYKVSFADVIFSIIGFITIFYFFRKDFNLKKNIVNKGGKTIKTTFINITKLIITLGVGVLLLFVAYKLYGNQIIELYKYGAYILFSLAGLFIIISIIQLSRTISDLFDISDIIVYLTIFILQFGLSGFIFYKYFIL